VHFLPIPSQTIHPHELDSSAQNIHPHELPQIEHLHGFLCSVPHLDPWALFRATGPQSNHWRDCLALDAGASFPLNPIPPPPSARQRRTSGQDLPGLLPLHFLPIPSQTIHPHELDNGAQNIHPHELPQITQATEVLCNVTHSDPRALLRATGPQSHHWGDCLALAPTRARHFLSTPPPSAVRAAGGWNKGKNTHMN
jgi:hypothetical protein